MRLGDCHHDREPEPAAVRRLPGAIATLVALEDPVLVGGVDAGALVAHPEPRSIADQRGAEPDRVAGARVVHGVLGQVHDRLGEPLLVGHHDPDPGPVEAPVAVAEALRLREEVVGEQVEVDRARPQEVGPRRPRQHQQLVDVAAHPVELLLNHRDRLLTLSWRVAERLDVAADHGDWSAQLVADVGEEVLLMSERGLEPVQHAVEGSAELGDLVAAANRDPARQVRIGDRPCGPRQRVQGGDRASGGEPDE